MAKRWANARGGTWHLVEKFWFIPIQLKKSEVIKAIREAVAELGDCIAQMGTVFISCSPKLAQQIEPLLKQEQGQLTSIQKIPEWDEKNFDVMLPYLIDGEEKYQLQGWAKVAIEGKRQRVCCYPERPNYNPEGILANVRIYQDSEGNLWHCIPWSNPTDRSDFPFWIDETEEKEPYSPPPEKPAATVKLLTKEGQPTWLEVEISQGDNIYFWKWVRWCRTWEGSEFLSHPPRWHVPFGDNSSEELLELCQSQKYGKVALSEELAAILKV